MNTNLMLDEHERANEEQIQKMADALKTCLQTSLVGESQNFRSWVAASHRKFHEQQRWALITTGVACLASFLILGASIWQAHRITRQTASQWQALQAMQGQLNANTDPFASLRQANLKPVGKLITQNGRIFTELKPAK